MKFLTYRTAATAFLIAVLSASTVAHAQVGDILKKGESAGSSGDLGSLGSALGKQSVTAGSTGNVAGLLDFCIKNNFLGGDAASSVKDKLMGKLSGGSPSSDKGYTDGAKGVLNSSDGKKLDLSGSGMKAEVSKQVCDKILAQGKSLL